MPAKGTTGGRGTGLRKLLAMGILACGLGHLATPLAAAQAGLERFSGLPWASGMNGATSENAGFAAWRGNRKLDARTIFFGFNAWSNLISSAGALSWATNANTGRLVVALAMLPRIRERLMR